MVSEFAGRACVNIDKLVEVTQLVRNIYPKYATLASAGSYEIIDGERAAVGAKIISRQINIIKLAEVEAFIDA